MSKIIVFQSCIAILFSSVCVQICSAQIYMCNPNKYAKPSKFESNLNVTLTNLAQHTSSSGGFNTSVKGESSDTVYGLLQCRADASTEECYNCSQQAKALVQRACGNAIGGRVWLEMCYLRYESNNFIGRVDTVDHVYLVNQNNATDPDAFSIAVRGILRKLSEEANRSEKLYASGSTVDSSLYKINGFLQCWRDISKDDCTNCLLNATQGIIKATYNATSSGGSAYLGSCMARYEIYPFFKSLPAGPAPVEAPNSLPPKLVPVEAPNSPSSTIPKQTQSNRNAGKSSNKMSIIMGVFVSFLLIVI